mmetsp:Transcript_8715/g.12881  ORF Transcript_8715/g.12881 Transcript_8715/m.12881 type:complete len:316 (+) Transcript_8715:42-989(+)
MSETYEAIQKFIDEYENVVKKEEMKKKISQFCQENRNRSIIIITSGRTVVPLEKKTVRYISNFSTGRRGALCTEELFKKSSDYAVIYFHHKHAIKPFSWKSLYKEDDIMDEIELTDKGFIKFKNQSNELKDHITMSKDVKSKNKLLEVPFNTLFEYLILLKEITSMVNQSHGKKGIIFASAAVSDFYIPMKNLAENKIQSRDHHELHLKLKPTPKMLLALRNKWAPDLFCVGFKLETDEGILMEKVQSAQEKYGIHLTVANILGKHRHQVIMVPNKKLSKEEPTEYKIDEESKCKKIETYIIDHVLSKHQHYLNS